MARFGESEFSVASGNWSRADIAARGRNVRNEAAAIQQYFYGGGQERDQSQGQPSKFLHTSHVLTM